jgi:sugar fermentation stimulation protein A
MRSMQFASALIPGRFVRRYKRFFADVELEDGTLVVAHCANPGSMRTCLIDGARVWLSHSDDPRRKLRYTWQILDDEHGRVFVNPALANDVVAEALALGRIPELSAYAQLRREVITSPGSRVDFVLENSESRCFVEVKNVTLTLARGQTAFPDSVTERGTRHLRELIRLRDEGHRAVLLFCAAREDALSVEPADAIDPAYGAALRAAARAGVELLAYRCSFGSNTVHLDARVPVHLPKLTESLLLSKPKRARVSLAK